MNGWCYRCECVESTHRVEYSEACGIFASERWVQEFCETCASEKIELLGSDRNVWDVEVSAI